MTNGKDLCISQEDYCKSGFSKCPNISCKSTDISGGPIEVDGNICTQHLDCISCGSTWTDVYELQGFTDFTTEDE